VTWFETLTGCHEESPEQVREHLAVDGNQLRSKIDGNAWSCGELQTPTLAELRKRARRIPRTSPSTNVREVVADVQALHCDSSNAGAMFQVASQFNLLEMTSPKVIPEDGVGIYEGDFTQGPACAIAAGAGTIYRNYFAEVNGQVGQTSQNQIDCLADIGQQLGNTDQRLWAMENGYALPTKNGLARINQQLNDFDESKLDELRGLLRIGLQLDTQVTLRSSSHVVSQAYCSAMPVSYSEHSSELWAPFAIVVLEAAYEATICAAIENAHRTGNNRVYLTLLGGGAFGNEINWITDSILRAIGMYCDRGLDIAIVSYGASKPVALRLTQTPTQHMRDRTQR
jgi:hypothetical protein